MKSTLPRLFQCTLRRLGHENPLGLPRSGTPPHWPRRPERRKIRGVERVVAVTSAKGGVGKSTVAANLSLAFARLGYRAGILDVDVFGPSIPTLFDLSGEPRLSENNQLIPLTNYGVKTMSMGYLVGEDSPVVWRGPMVMKSVQQLLHQVDWGASGLDILVLDLPPGTGDTQLTITQQVILDGALVVTTPHALAVRDAIRGVNMFRAVGVDILGLVQNMGLYRCPSCGDPSHVFGGHDRVLRMCRDLDLPLLADIPLHPSIGDDADRGRPTVVAEPQSPRAEAFVKLAEAVAAKIHLSKS
ncbi:P-loop containing nucleoside triphosphate hydrolase protein [Sodiomyces alkalinus F11]|uniref:P-loop containing nucleoside triphosphate hydrolase protein n=1 Tax=Sodiomyces alkalinus (strain CBS 110278 / VKM F-3762 / F11) TaxID=1314773 RepID=A0A3N2Q6U0_SODAK|nr:P-loop containing nucleoside triphosphate hydrolase protein [Sodiomyces alkalinus F11]ROT42509.1 P-loop containing nucleoside triphosphate hydrolase protein [Sodiomyces alkalinus F11]